MSQLKNCSYSSRALVGMLYERDYAGKDILELFRFIDWVLVLPEELDADFADAVAKYEEAAKMPYVTSVERVGLKRGENKGILGRSREVVLEVLRVRFRRIPRAITSAVNALEDPAYLKELHREAVTTPSIAAFEESLKARACG